MKTVFSIVLVLFIPFLLEAQVLEERRTMALGEQPAFVLNIDNADDKWLEREWRDFMSTYGKVRKVKRADEYWIDDAQIMSIGGVDPIDIYGRADESANGATLLVWVDLGDRFVNSTDHPEKYIGTVKLIQEFQHSVRVELVEMELEEQEKQLSNLERDLKKLERNNEGYHRDIEKAEKTIRNAREAITKNEIEQETARQQIAAQAELVEAVKRKLEQTRSEGSDQ